MVGAVSLNPYVSSYQYAGGYGRGSGRNMQVQAGAGVSAAGRVPGRQAAAAEHGSGQQAEVSAAGRVSGQQAEAAAGVRSVSAGRTGGVSSLIGARSIAAAGQVSGVAGISAGRAADPESPVQPVDKISAVQKSNPGSTNYMIPFLRKGMDPAELSVRMRMQYADGSMAGGRSQGISRQASAGAAEAAGVELPGTSRAAGREAAQLDYLPGMGTPQGAEKETAEPELPGMSRNTEKEAVQLDLPGSSEGTEGKAIEPELPGTRSTEKAVAQAGLPGSSPESDDRAAVSEKDAPKIAGMGTESAQKTAEEAECKTCKERKYQDGSDDPGVSFKTPGHIAPEQSASRVRGHEMEHVVHERAKAKNEGRRVISQSVTMQTGICPECGRVYTAGGVTRTTTAADTKPKEEPKDPKWILTRDI